MTGRQPARVGMPGVINSLSAAGLPLSEVTLANDLSSLGCELECRCASLALLFLTFEVVRNSMQTSL